jgi:hypothetical protein
MAVPRPASWTGFLADLRSLLASPAASAMGASQGSGDVSNLTVSRERPR